MLEIINQIKALNKLLKEERQKEDPNKEAIRDINRQIAELGIYLNNQQLFDGIKGRTPF